MAKVERKGQEGKKTKEKKTGNDSDSRALAHGLRVCTRNGGTDASVVIFGVVRGVGEVVIKEVTRRVWVWFF